VSTSRDDGGMAALGLAIALLALALMAFA